MSEKTSYINRVSDDVDIEDELTENEIGLG